MPNRYRSSTAPLLLGTVLDALINHRYPFSPPASENKHADATTWSAIHAAVAPNSLSCGLGSLGPYATASTPLPPTPTISVAAGASTLPMFLTILLSIVLFLAIIVKFTRIFGLTSWLPLRTTPLRCLLPSIKQILFPTIISVALLRWPSLHDYPIEEICNVIIQSWCDRVASRQLKKESQANPEADIHVPAALKMHPRCIDRPIRRVAIVLERREDRTLWVVELNAPLTATSTGYRLRQSQFQTQRLTSSGGTVADMDEIATKFTSARDWVPAAPWRVLGLHEDPVIPSSSPSHSVWIEKGLTAYPLDAEHAAEHFTYSWSHDPKVKVDANDASDSSQPRYTTSFWSSSARAQVTAWTFIRLQSRSAGPDIGQEFYTQFGIEPHLAKLNLAIVSEKEELEQKKEARRMRREEDEERFRRDQEEADERRRQQYKETDERARQELEAIRRKKALLKRSIKNYWQRQSGAEWRDASRLRSTRNS